MAPSKKSPRAFHISFHLQLVLFYIVIFPAAASTSLCSNPSPAPKELPQGNDALELLRSFQITTGYFSGGGGLFAPDDDDDSSYIIPRSFSLSPYKVARTTDSDILEVAATLTLYGPPSDHGGGGSGARRRRHHYAGSQTASFHLHGYYTSTSGELCFVDGSGSYSVDGGPVEHLRDVNLRLRIPNTPRLADPFVTGVLYVAGFEAISLVAYVENDRYAYGETRPSCPPPTPAPHAARGALQALDAKFSCSHLRELLVGSYRLENASVDASSASNTSPLSRGGLRGMHVNQMHCAANDSVRAYVVFSNDTDAERRWWRGSRFLVKDEAVVADGYWDPATSRLCLRACRVAHSPATKPSTTSTELKVSELCGIGMSFWFPGVWTIRDRSVVAGLLWNATSQEVTGDKHAGAVLSGAISASSIDGYGRRRSNLTDVKYNYTMADKAKTQYLSSELSKSKKGRFPGNSSMYSYNDFRFNFFMEATDSGSGHASPVTIGSLMIDGDQLDAEYMFFRYAMGEMNKSRPTVARMDHSQLLNVSYDISYHVRSANWQPPKNRSSYPYAVPMERRTISAEGVYDPKTGILYMLGCQAINGSTDCQILVTVHFASLDAKGNGHGKGKISSTRDKADRLHFEAIDITLYGMYTEQIDESILRMDLEILMAVVSATLSCVFAALQIRHARSNPASAPAATSVAMLAVLALGQVTHLAVNVDALFVNRRTHYVPFSTNGWLDLNEVMLRVPTLIAFALHLCLLQLVVSSRRSADHAIAEKWSLAEKKSLRMCLPLYVLGGLLAVTVHVINNGRAAREGNPLIVRVAADTGTLWDDLVSYAGLILDGFLLPQVVLNVFSRSRVRAISPWFYVGVTVLRATPHAYDALRARSYVPSVRPSSYAYASPREDLFGVAWDVAVPLVGASLALLLFLQQRLGSAFFVRGRRFGEYEMVPSPVGSQSQQEFEKAMD